MSLQNASASCHPSADATPSEPTTSSAAESWQTALADLVTDPAELIALLGLNPAQKTVGLAAQQAFPLRVPRAFVERMQPGNWNDPLLRQVWPAQEETEQHPDLIADPLQEQSFNAAPGLLQKYAGRVLLMAAPHCAIHCRYCFRRHFDYDSNSPGRAEWQPALDHICGDTSIHEVILSGGDPLANSDRQLRWLLQQLERIAHLSTLRIHTRLPVVIPERVTPSLCNLLQASRFNIVMVIHSNHAQELDMSCATALQTLRQAGATVLNQSVILRGVNDEVATLISLSERLFEAGVLPYYLHLPDAVDGTAHFQVSDQRAMQLVQGMRGCLPGYLVPRLVREIPGRDAKTILA
ncbi:MAG: EF-P beta-lysylation protein EpmB [Pseudomonadota bacterium]